MYSYVVREKREFRSYYSLLMHVDQWREKFGLEEALKYFGVPKGVLEI